ncbi:MAG TPA: hypothetical protein VHU83_23930 [Bryobacteraceae bacterium]|jgi:hypothetical protein|nr:hypothetical protein [Bryobacteraceae bacterium]
MQCTRSSREDFLHVVNELQRRYSAIIRVQIIRPIIGGGAGPEQIILAEVESRQVDT